VSLNNLIKRALTGIVFVAVIIGAICWHPFSFLALFSIITGMILWEFHGLVKLYENEPVKRLIRCLGGVYLFAATFFYTQGLTGKAIFFPYILFLLYCLIIELYNKKSNPINNWSSTFFAQVYCAGSFSLLNFIFTETRDIEILPQAPIFVLAVFIFIWLNDTGAYLIGTLFGKHRLFERISPKKSWEGFWGGFIVALLTSQLFYYLVPEISRFVWLGLAATVVVFGTWGDLAESLLKRTLNLKDSGNCFPGHGGMLDRFDSIITAIPVAYIYIEMIIRN
jgi:phosphatidate cytidylyltransferase